MHAAMYHIKLGSSFVKSLNYAQYISLTVGYFKTNKKTPTKTNRRNLSFQMENVPAMSLDEKANFCLILGELCQMHGQAAVPKKSPPDFKSARNQTADADAVPSWRFVSVYGFCDFSSLKTLCKSCSRSFKHCILIVRSLLA